MNREEIKAQIIEYMKMYVPDGEAIGAEKILRVIESNHEASSINRQQQGVCAKITFWDNSIKDEAIRRYPFPEKKNDDVYYNISYQSVYDGISQRRKDFIDGANFMLNPNGTKTF